MKEWGIRYSVFNKKDLLVIRVKYFSSENQRTNWIESQTSRSMIVDVTAYLDPE